MFFGGGGVLFVKLFDFGILRVFFLVSKFDYVFYPQSPLDRIPTFFLGGGLFSKSCIFS